MESAAYLYPGAGTMKGHPVVYCTLNPSTALLETLVHMEIDSEDRPERFQVLRIEGPDSLSTEEIALTSLPSDWAEDMDITQTVGRSLAHRRALVAIASAKRSRAGDMERVGQSATRRSQFSQDRCHI